METFNKNKFKEVLHYIIHKCSALDNVGQTVLYKILYFSDFDFYEKYESFLTGETYVKLPFGPAPQHFKSIIDELKDSKSIKLIRTYFHGKSQNKFICIKEPEIKTLDAQEIKLIDQTIDKLGNMTAKQITAYSHLDLPWKSAKSHKELDYELVFYRDDTLSVRDYNNE